MVTPQIDGPGREVIARAIAEIQAHGLRYEVGAAGTGVEGDLEAILDAVRAIESRLRTQGVRRAVIELRLQLEPHPETLEHQVEGVAASLGGRKATMRIGRRLDLAGCTRAFTRAGGTPASARRAGRRFRLTTGRR